MSIVHAIHEHYANHPRRLKPPTGWPTASRLGTCTAQLQMLRRPDLYPVLPLPPRTLRVFEQGNRIEKWLGERLNECYPGLVGMAQEPYFFPIRVTPEQRTVLMERISNRTIWGRVMERFNEPKLYLGDDGRVKTRLVPRDNQGKPVNFGFVLDLDRSSLWVPGYIDFAVKHKTFGLAIVEAKALSNFAFRRAVMGFLDYGKRCQLSAYARSTGANVVLVGYRSETGHLVEVAYLRGVERTRVALTKPNGSQEIFWVDAKTGPDDKAPLIPDAGGEPRGLPADLVWEAADTWTPYDASIEAEVDQRVLDVLLFDGDPAHLKREAGPSFDCPTCDGTGTQTRRKGSATHLKAPKPCEDCAQGVREEVELNSWPCSYCPIGPSVCMASASPRLEIDDRPHWYVKRADYQQSGLTVQRPAGWS